MISDALYFAGLESKELLVHYDSNVIKAMAAFVYIAILKDVFTAVLVLFYYKGSDFFRLKHLKARK